jgi:hypothetical protein
MMHEAKLDGAAVHAQPAPSRAGCGHSHIVQRFAFIAVELDPDTFDEICGDA